MKPRKGWVDLDDATVPTRTSCPLPRNLLENFFYAAASSVDQMKSVPLRHMRCRMPEPCRIFDFDADDDVDLDDSTSFVATLDGP